MKRRAYWLLWKKANEPNQSSPIPGVSVEESGMPEDGVTIIGE